LHRVSPDERNDPSFGSRPEAEEDTMAMVTDPVCGMRIDSDDAAATAEYEGKTYYFCSEVCHDVFVADPAPYAG
jgi:P-type Cu+ transporter